MIDHVSYLRPRNSFAANASGQRIAMRANDELYYFLTDHLGSTNITLNASGSKIAELRYMPWGSQR